MYTKRDSELIQQFLQQHGHLPGMGGELDELYEDMDDHKRNLRRSASPRPRW